MTETFIALLLAHALTDFVFQTRWMVANKRRPAVTLLHGALVLGLSLACVGGAPLLAAAVAAAHVVIDLVKAWSGRAGAGAFLADQAAHLATLGAGAALAPDAWAAGLWAGILPAAGPVLLAQAFLFVAGLVLATRAGGFAVGLFLAGRSADAPDDEDGLPGGGRDIGMLERGIVFLLVWAGQPGATGLLIAAKSILRFGAVREDRRASEYVIIGTLASVAWVLCIAFASVKLRGYLAP